MIQAILLLLAQAQTPASATANPASGGAALISKMFALYANAKSMTGKIQMVQQAQNQTVELDTDIAYESPSKLYLKQALNTSGGRQWLVTSDGTDFTYDFPNDARTAANGEEPHRWLEHVNPGGGVQPFDYRGIFRVALRSLGDISIPELLAIGGTAELTTIKNQIVSISIAGTDTVNGQQVHVLIGEWRLDQTSPATGSYKLFITDDGQLKRFVEREIVAVNLPNVQAKPQEVVTTWNVDLKPNGKPDEALLKVVR